MNRLTAWGVEGIGEIIPGVPVQYEIAGAIGIRLVQLHAVRSSREIRILRAGVRIRITCHTSSKRMPFVCSFPCEAATIVDKVLVVSAIGQMSVITSIERFQSFVVDVPPRLALGYQPGH